MRNSASYSPTVSIAVCRASMVRSMSAGWQRARRASIVSSNVPRL
jgi:hypothetical protein